MTSASDTYRAMMKLNRAYGRLIGPTKEFPLTVGDLHALNILRQHVALLGREYDDLVAREQLTQGFTMTERGRA